MVLLDQPSSDTAMQTQYSRLVKNLSTNNATYRDTLIKSVSATKTHLDAINNKVLNDDVEAAVRQFEVALGALNDLLEDCAVPAPCPMPQYNPFGADGKPKMEMEVVHYEEPVASKRKPKKSTPPDPVEGEFIVLGDN